MKRITPIKAIRNKCLDCMGNSKKHVKACPVLDCSLWKFRLGIHPFTKKNYKNPFLDKKNFKGIESLTSSQLISKINSKNDKEE